MPFATIGDLPDSIKNRFKTTAERRAFLGAFNSAFEGTCKDGGRQGDREGCSFAVGMTAAQNVKKSMEAGVEMTLEMLVEAAVSKALHTHMSEEEKRRRKKLLDIKDKDKSGKVAKFLKGLVGLLDEEETEPADGFSETLDVADELDIEWWDEPLEKQNPHHDPDTGQFTSGPGGGGAGALKVGRRFSFKRKKGLIARLARLKARLSGVKPSEIRIANRGKIRRITRDKVFLETDDGGRFSMSRESFKRNTTLGKSEDTVSIVKAGSIVKTDDELQVFYAPVFVPDEEHSQGLVTTGDPSEPDVVSKDEIRKAAHGFMIELALSNDVRIGINHDDDNPLSHEQVQMVESWLEKADVIYETPHGPELVPEGAWMAGIHVDADIWKSLKDGDLAGLSMKGTGVRTLV